MIRKAALFVGLVTLLSLSIDEKELVVAKHHTPRREVQEVFPLAVPSIILFPTGNTYVEPETYSLELRRTAPMFTPRGPIPSFFTRHEEVSKEIYKSTLVGAMYR